MNRKKSVFIGTKYVIDQNREKYRIFDSRKRIVNTKLWMEGRLAVSRTVLGLVLAIAFVAVLTMLYLGGSRQPNNPAEVKLDPSGAARKTSNPEISSQSGAISVANEKIKYSPGVFAPAAEITTERLGPWITDVYFRKGYGKGYVRHDVIKIDVNLLTELVDKQINVISPDITQSALVRDIQLPIDLAVAPGKSLSVFFDKVAVAAPGLFGLSGHLMNGPKNSQAKVTVDYINGRVISGYVFDGNNRHVLAPTPEAPYYLVIEVVPQVRPVDEEFTRPGGSK